MTDRCGTGFGVAIDLVDDDALLGLTCRSRVFAGGVGENSQEVREATVAGFSFLGLKLDAEKNAQSPADTNIATEDSSARVLIIHTQEDWEIAREGWQLVEAGKMQGAQH